MIPLATTTLVMIVSTCHSKLFVIPRDTEVKINDSTYLNCSTSLDANLIQWRHGDNYVYTGITFLEPYNDGRFSVEINFSTGASDLVIYSVRPSDAGQYKCLEDEGFGEISSAQLIVLDDDPICRSNMHSDGVIGPNSCSIEPELVKLSCSATYHGNVFPILQWKESGHNESITKGLINITSSRPTKDVTYTLTMNSSLDLSGASYVCQTTRATDKHYSCSSGAIRILYIFSSEVTDNLSMNDEVNCFANTSMSCSYKWKWFDGGDITTESNNQILKPKKVGRHRCEATCSLRSQSCLVESVYDVTVVDLHVGLHSVKGLATSNQNLMALLVLLVLPVTVMIVLLMYHSICCKRGTTLTQELMDQQRLIDELPEKYRSTLVSVKSIRTKAAEEADKWIFGLTILDNELFVVSEQSSEVEVFNSSLLTLSRRWNLKELIRPRDIVSCVRNKSLYIVNSKGDDQPGEILKVGQSSEVLKVGQSSEVLKVGQSSEILKVGQPTEILKVDSNGKLRKKWSIGDDSAYGLSVTHEANLIVAVSNRSAISEYSLDGELIREINLLSDVRVGICHPWHAVKLPSGHFVVSHGCCGDVVHRVCIVDLSGHVMKLFGGKCGSSNGRTNLPVYLAVDKLGYVLVADQMNRRVLLLDSDLEYMRVILPIDEKEQHWLQGPERILLNEPSGRLFVVDNECNTGGQILVYKFQ